MKQGNAFASLLLFFAVVSLFFSCMNPELSHVSDSVEAGSRAAVGVNLVTNPGFESQMTGWSTSGTSSADYAQTENPYGGSYNLCHWSGSSWTVDTYQVITGLENGLYTLSVWARNWDTDTSQIRVSDYGGSMKTTGITSSNWSKIVLSNIPVTNGQAKISLYTSSNGGCTVFDEVSFYKSSAGGDSAIEILRDHGFNYARIRLLAEPGDAYGLHQDLDYVIETAQAAKAEGMGILLDIFYSHWWCDPSQNWKPESWTSDYNSLKTQAYDYTREVLQAMNRSGVMPDLVQVGNEVNDGMMWTPGRISANGWSSYIGLSNQGYWGVKSVSSSLPVIIHYAGVGSGALSWYSNFVSNGGLMDAAGLSFYEMWHGSISDCVSTLNQIHSKLGKDVYVVETAAYWKRSEGGNSTSYSQTEQGQYDYLYDFTKALKDVNGLKGLFYWGAAWTQADLWLDAPAWSDDDAGCRGLFDDNAQATTGVDAIFDAGGFSVVGIIGADVSEALYAESQGVNYTDH